MEVVNEDLGRKGGEREGKEEKDVLHGRRCYGLEELREGREGEERPGKE